jgi:hypothetical protein
MFLRADLIRFAHPPLDVFVEVGFRVYTERVACEVSRVLLDLEEARIIIDSRQRKPA